jgi:DNA-binding response OmpR family regulator
MLGPIREEMGGEMVHSGSASTLTISNNVTGYLLKATGETGRIEGIPNLVWDNANTVLSSSADIYISGSNNNLYLHGTNNLGETVRFKVSINGGIIKIVD